jgi:hypothetical protein
MPCGFPLAVGTTTVSLVVHEHSAHARWTVMAQQQTKSGNVYTASIVAEN